MKYLFTALSVVFGIFIGMMIPKNETGLNESEDFGAVCTINEDFIYSDLTWSDISAIGKPLIDRHLWDLKINDFTWRLVGFGDPTHLPEHDILILNDACDLDAPPKELKEWMKRNSHKLTSISFGDSISFSAVTWLCEYFEKNNFRCGLSTYTNSSNSIMIDLFWADEKWKPKMIMEPNQTSEHTGQPPEMVSER